MNCQESWKDYTIYFDDKYGQIEIGSKYAGVEFHHSCPLPSRISFYYPVANSLDLSTDYWKRDQSFPISLVVKHDGITDTISNYAFPYNYTPYHAIFKKQFQDFLMEISYDFCEDLPVVVLNIRLINISDGIREFIVQTELKPILRSCHTYSWIQPEEALYHSQGKTYLAQFYNIETDSTVLFIENAGEDPDIFQRTNRENVKDSVGVFQYKKQLVPRQEMAIIQLIGTCSLLEEEKIKENSLANWKKSQSENKKRIDGYALDLSHFGVGDSELEQTAVWSKAIIASNIHYLHGQFVPMPCPAEYNFFFTHDLLLTSLGVVNFDLEYVKNGLSFLAELTKEDAILPHAYYWKDGQYITEFCGSDNWNHLWFIITAASYLKHSNDFETLDSIFPILKRSLSLMLENKGEDNLMYAKRPDWWDIGNKYGARVYVSALMYKALNDYVYIITHLRKDDSKALFYLKIADEIKNAVNEHFWDEEVGYLFNMLDEKKIDRHYYSGSLVAAWFNLIEGPRRIRLLQTVKDTLLDDEIGIRNAMPNDFHTLDSLYKFVKGEVGEPFVYFNGGVWSHGNAWYALALLADNQPDMALQVLKKYLTLAGIQKSPNGQPSFYEYRMTNPHSDRYGEIDKPTFLWAGGWFLHVLYRLAGLRENSYNAFFDPCLPEEFVNMSYDVTLLGKLSQVQWKGKGNHFQSILIDGQPQYSAVIYSPSKSIILTRGFPEKPYLAEGNCSIETVEYSPSQHLLSIRFSGITEQNVRLVIISPQKLKMIKLNKNNYQNVIDEQYLEEIYIYSITFPLAQQMNEMFLFFK